MLWGLSEEDQAAEIKRNFLKVGQQFKLFYDAMREAGLPKPLSRKLTASYGQVVCELLYCEGTGEGDGGGVDTDPYAGGPETDRDE